MNELIEKLIAGLGLGQDQAKGGVGLLLNVLKSHLGGGDFSKITSLFDGGDVDDAIKAAPDTESGLGGLLGGLASAVGGDKAGSLADLLSGFKKLDIDVGKMDDFGEIAMGFLKDKGGDEILGMVKGIFGK